MLNAPQMLLAGDPARVTTRHRVLGAEPRLPHLRNGGEQKPPHGAFVRNQCDEASLSSSASMLPEVQGVLSTCSALFWGLFKY